MHFFWTYITSRRDYYWISKLPHNLFRSNAIVSEKNKKPVWLSREQFKDLSILNTFRSPLTANTDHYAELGAT